MTELTFLVELLLNHKLPKVTRDLVATRIKEVEEGYSVTKVTIPLSSGISPSALSAVPSSRDVAARHPDFVPAVMPPVPVTIAQTPAAAAAMNSRNQAIAESLAGKIDKNTGRPRKF